MNKSFMQAVRTTKVTECDLLDPLSMFAAQKDTVTEPAPAAPSIYQALGERPKEDTRKAQELSTSNLKNVDVKSNAQGGNTPLKAQPAPVSKSVVNQQTGEDDSPLRFLSGEQKVMSILDSFITVATGEIISGTLFMTNYRLVFIPSMADLSSISITNPSIHSWLQIPIASIEKIEKEKRGKDVNSTINIAITCKDFRMVRIAIRSNTTRPNSGDNDIERAISVISAYAFPNNMKYLFAFTHKLNGVQEKDQAPPYDPIIEFSRMGVLDNPQWRITNANSSYQLCSTYPQTLVVPAGITDEELHTVAGFRSGHRLPVLCWADRESGASMWRSAQPKAGVSGSCSQDEKMLDLIARSCAYNYSRKRTEIKRYSNDNTLFIVDCRSRASAMANRAAGAGYESQANYSSSKLDFYGISNIHAVRDMYKSLAGILLSAPTSSSSDTTFTKQFEDTQWLNSLRNIIKASYDTAQFLYQGAPVLVHCSHGWDRTAQVCALAQLFIDPYYRTFEGFKVLVEREWVSLGHPFQMRCAHSQDKATRADDQLSPIMLQFLDCVWQIHHQCMQYFEFNARYILTVADHVYSGRFGTFLFSSDSDRDNFHSRQLCPDLWTYLQCNRSVLSNPLYTNPDRVLLPPLSQLLRNVTIWSDFFLRWSSSPSVAPIPLQLSQHLYADGLCRPLQADDLHDDEVLVDSQGTALSTSADFEVPAAVTSNDYWEAAFRVERMKKISVEARQERTIRAQQNTINQLCRMLREQAPGVSEDTIAAAMGAPPSASTSSAQLSQLPHPAVSAVPTKDMTIISPSTRVGASVPISMPMEVPIPFPTQSLDTLQYADHSTSAQSQSPSPVPTDESPRAQSDDKPNGGIVIHEKYHDLFITPVVPPIRNSDEDDVQSIDTPRSVNTPHAATAAVDDESFYPEDDEMGVSV